MKRSLDKPKGNDLLIKRCDLAEDQILKNGQLFNAMRKNKTAKRKTGKSKKWTHEGAQCQCKGCQS
jgi:hypothetical protein